MSYYGYIFVVFAVLFQELFYFAGSVSYVCPCLLMTDKLAKLTFIRHG